MEHISQGTTHEMYDSDPHFSIDPVTRILTYESPEKLTVIQGDHNSQIFTFDIPRFVDGHDMKLCNSVQAHYINVSGDNPENRSVGFSAITDVQICQDDEDLIVFSWPIPSNATKYSGSLSFLVRFACTNGSKITYVWNTAVYSGVPVGTGMDNTDIVLEEFPNVLEEWYVNLLGIGTAGVNAISDAKDTAISDIENAKKQALDEFITKSWMYGMFVAGPEQPVASIATVWLDTNTNSLKVRSNGESSWRELNVLMGDINYITNEVGYNEKLAMSQKKVTEIAEAVSIELVYLLSIIEPLKVDFEALEDNVASVELKYDLTTRLYDNCDRRIDVIETRLKDIDLLQTDNSVIRVSIAEHGEMINTLDTKRAAMNSRLQTVEAGVASLEENAVTLYDRCSRFEERLNFDEGSLTTITRTLDHYEPTDESGDIANILNQYTGGDNSYAYESHINALWQTVVSMGGAVSSNSYEINQHANDISAVSSRIDGLLDRIMALEAKLA